MGAPRGDHTLRSLACASGKHAIGVQVYAGIYLHGLYVECASLGPAGWYIDSLGFVCDDYNK